MQTHSKEKLFRCEFCRKRFGLRSYLVKHYEVGACAKRKNNGDSKGRSSKNKDDNVEFDAKDEELVKQRMKSLVQELKKEEEAERAANKQMDDLEDAGTSNGKSSKRKPRKVRKCNVSLNKPISLEEYEDDEDYDESEEELEMNKTATKSRNYAKTNLNNEHDYYSLSNGDKEDNDEQIIEINGEIIKGAQIVYVDGKELTEDGSATIQV